MATAANPNSSTPLLALRDLRISFAASQVVHGISLSLAPGQVLGLVGESGSGKSVSSLAILGLLGPPAQVSGSILWQGRELLGQPAHLWRTLRGREIAMVFQEPMTALNPVMTIGRQLTEGLQAHQPALTRRELRQRAIAALEEVALPDPERRLRDYPHQFSGGQRQRILIAMALLHRPDLLIADEPTTALDVTVQAQILDLLARLRREHSLAILFTSHDLAVVSQVANQASDRVAVMRGGLVVEEGPTAHVLHHPTHPYTQSLLAAVPTMRTDRSHPLATLQHA